MAAPHKILKGTVEEAKRSIEQEEAVDYQELLKSEKSGKNRESLKHFLKNRAARSKQLKENKKEETSKESKEASEIDYSSLVEKTIKEVKQEVQREDDVDFLKLLESEKENQDREVLLKWIRNQINGDDPEEDEKAIESNFEELESKMKNVITDIKKSEDETEESTTDPRNKIQDINEGVEDKVKKKGRVTEPKQDEEESKDAEENEDDASVGAMPDPDDLQPDESAPKEEMAKKNHNVDSEEEYEKFEARIKEHGENFRKIRDMMSQVIVGQENAVERVLIALMCDGNVLLEGVPGLGKSLTVETLSRTISDTEFNRIQFVPDMLPSDILGQRVYNQEKGEFYINKGPVFANFLLADEINRAPPKTQAAMMEVMQEKKVSIEKEEFQLEPPYLVLATQNPLEQKGTYPLPEAVIDRFFMKLVLDYPEPDEEVEILQRNSIKDTDPFSVIEEVVSKEDILKVQEDVRDIYISPEVQKYIVELITTARGRKDNGVESMEFVDFGPSPRASIWLSLGASSYAILDDRTYVIPDDVKKIAKPILRHRILLNYEGKISEYSTDDVIEEILESVDTV